MTTYSARVWLPDRPGALGLVASRIGAVGGDVVAIDILERGGGRAIDELTITLPDQELVQLLLAKVHELDGVDVEDVHEIPTPTGDPRLDALEAATSLLEQPGVGSLVEMLLLCAGRELSADWAAVVDLAAGTCRGQVGDAPSAPWLAAFLEGTRSSGPLPVPGDEARPPDIGWALLDRGGLGLVVGRQGRPFRLRERKLLVALARVADHRCVDLAGPAGDTGTPPLAVGGTAPG
ncbi:MAG TPA: hypothetical protein VE152_04430 [Acidimicrobiales bacterium]|nr:hypothetical protein [Acidimicrobiales bacterium]